MERVKGIEPSCQLWCKVVKSGEKFNITSLYFIPVRKRFEPVQCWRCAIHPSQLTLAVNVENHRSLRDEGNEMAQTYRQNVQVGHRRFLSKLKIPKTQNSRSPGRRNRHIGSGRLRCRP